MNFRTSEKRSETGAGSAEAPAVLRFEARLFEHPAAKSGSRVMLEVPAWVSDLFPPLCSSTIEGIINGHPFRAALAPGANAGRWFPVNRAMLKGAEAGAGDTVRLAILMPETDPEVPSDLRSALAASREAMTLWDGLTISGRLDWVRWVESAKQDETRTRRVKRTVEQLSEGKRRACCVNVYEFMLRRIRDDNETGIPESKVRPSRSDAGRGR